MHVTKQKQTKNIENKLEVLNAKREMGQRQNRAMGLIDTNYIKIDK